MSNLNQFFVSGHLVRDVDLRTTKQGNAVAYYTVASNQQFTDSNGERRERADFIQITSYGLQAESDARYLSKGASVVIQGSVRSWYNSQEQKGGYSFEVEKVQYNGQGQRTQAPAPAPQQQEQQQEQQQPPAAAAQPSTGPNGQWMADYEQAEQQKPTRAKASRAKAAA